MVKNKKATLVQNAYFLNGNTSFENEIAHSAYIVTAQSILSAFYNNRDEVLAIYETISPEEDNAWSYQFFVSVMDREQTLRKNSLKSVFVCNENQLLVPGALYQVQDAGRWFKQVNAVSEDETVHTQDCKAIQAVYLYSLPNGLQARLDAAVHKAPFSSLAGLHFGKAGGQAAEAQAYVTVSDTHALLSFRQKGSMVWHKVLTYSNAEDIVWELLAVAKKYNYNNSEIYVDFAACSSNCLLVSDTIKQYFPATHPGNTDTVPAGQANWKAVINLFQQIRKCAL